MLFDDFVYLSHQTPRFGKDGDDPSVVVNVILGKRTTFSVLEPVLCQNSALLK